MDEWLCYLLRWGRPRKSSIGRKIMGSLLEVKFEVAGKHYIIFQNFWILKLLHKIILKPKCSKRKNEYPQFSHQHPIFMFNFFMFCLNPYHSVHIAVINCIFVCGTIHTHTHILIFISLTLFHKTLLCFYISIW